MASVFGLSVLAGALWNLASLFCLRQLMRAWLGPRPSRARAIVWVLVKFPLLYALIVWLFRSPTTASILGFSLGFSLVLFGAVALFLRRTLRLRALEPHVR